MPFAEFMRKYQNIVFVFISIWLKGLLGLIDG
jgi:hypothetical protein